MDRYVALRDVDPRPGQITLVERCRDKKKFIRKRVMQFMRNELELLSHLRHPHIIELEEWFEADGFLYLIVEYAEEGDLRHAMTKRRGEHFTESQLLACFVGLLKAVQYLFTHQVAHRDIKPDNIVVTAEGIPKLADFGLGVRVDTHTAAQLYTRAHAKLFPSLSSVASPLSVCDASASLGASGSPVGEKTRRGIASDRASCAGGPRNSELQRLDVAEELFYEDLRAVTQVFCEVATLNQNTSESVLALLRLQGDEEQLFRDGTPRDEAARNTRSSGVATGEKRDPSLTSSTPERPHTVEWGSRPHRSRTPRVPADSSSLASEPPRGSGTPRSMPFPSTTPAGSCMSTPPEKREPQCLATPHRRRSSSLMDGEKAEDVAGQTKKKWEKAAVEVEVEREDSDATAVERRRQRATATAMRCTQNSSATTAPEAERSSRRTLPELYSKAFCRWLAELWSVSHGLLEAAQFKRLRGGAIRHARPHTSSGARDTHRVRSPPLEGSGKPLQLRHVLAMPIVKPLMRQGMRLSLYYPPPLPSVTSGTSRGVTSRDAVVPSTHHSVSEGTHSIDGGGPHAPSSAIEPVASRPHRHRRQHPYRRRNHHQTRCASSDVEKKGEAFRLPLVNSEQQPPPPSASAAGTATTRPSTAIPLRPPWLMRCSRIASPVPPLALSKAKTASGSSSTRLHPLRPQLLQRSQQHSSSSSSCNSDSSATSTSHSLSSFVSSRSSSSSREEQHQKAPCHCRGTVAHQTVPVSGTASARKDSKQREEEEFETEEAKRATVALSQYITEHFALGKVLKGESSFSAPPASLDAPANSDDSSINQNVSAVTPSVPCAVRVEAHVVNTRKGTEEVKRATTDPVIPPPSSSDRDASEPVLSLPISPVFDSTSDPTEALRHYVERGADVFTEVCSEKHRPLVHTFFWRGAETVPLLRICLTSPRPLDFTRRDREGFTVLHLLPCGATKSTATVMRLLEVLLERLHSPLGRRDVIDWAQTDSWGREFLVFVVNWRRLPAVLPLLLAKVPYYAAYQSPARAHSATSDPLSRPTSPENSLATRSVCAGKGGPAHVNEFFQMGIPPRSDTAEGGGIEPPLCQQKIVLPCWVRRADWNQLDPAAQACLQVRIMDR